MYCAFLILLRWAREAEIVRIKGQSQTNMNGGLAFAQMTVQENHQHERVRNLSKSLFSPAEFHAFILHVLKDELKNELDSDGIDNFTPTCAGAESSRVAYLVLIF